MPETKSICDFLSSTETKTFSIPQYQRNYSWDTLQFQEFWGDLEILLSTDAKHFLGLIVSIKDMNNNLEIVDGQQRLTTISILYIVLIDILSNLCKESDPSTLKFIKKVDRKVQDLKRFILYDRDDFSSIRLIPNNNDKEFYNDLTKDFEYIIENHPELNINKTTFEIKIDYLKSLTKNNGEKKWNFQFAQHFKAYKAYKFFYEEIMMRIKDKNSIEMKLNELDEIINSLMQFHVMSFSTTEDSEAFNLFETLNDRGLSLAAIDLIKNKFIQRCHQDIREEMSVSWDEVFGIEGILVDENHNLFLRQFYNSRNTPITHSQIYKEYSSDIKNIDAANDKDAMKKWLQNLSIAASDYISFKKLSNAESHELLKDNRELQEILHLLFKTKSVQWYTLAFSIFHRYRVAENKAQLKPIINKTFWLILKLVIHFMLLEKRFNTIEKIFPKLAKTIYTKQFDKENEILEDIDLFNRIDNEIMDLVPEDSLNLDDEIRDNNLAYILYRLCVLQQHKNDISSIDFNNITLEHIRPQDGKNWRDNIDSSLTYKLGNMTLLKQSSNSRVSNKPFIDKKLIYAEKGICDIAKPAILDIETEEEWDTVIPSRTTLISEQIKEILVKSEVPFSI